MSLKKTFFSLELPNHPKGIWGAKQSSLLVSTAQAGALTSPYPGVPSEESLGGSVLSSITWCHHLDPVCVCKPKHFSQHLRLLHTEPIYRWQGHGLGPVPAALEREEGEYMWRSAWVGTQCLCSWFGYLSILWHICLLCVFAGLRLTGRSHLDVAWCFLSLFCKSNEKECWFQSSWMSVHPIRASPSLWPAGALSSLPQWWHFRLNTLRLLWFVACPPWLLWLCLVNLGRIWPTWNRRRPWCSSVWPSMQNCCKGQKNANYLIYSWWTFLGFFLDSEDCIKTILKTQKGCKALHLRSPPSSPLPL